jgi:hypothetical protein
MRAAPGFDRLLGGAAWTCVRPLPVPGGCALLLTLLITPQITAQQSPSPMQPELRADAIVARATAVELGGGAVWPVGDYLRLGGDLAAGVVARAGAGGRLGARADAVGRFHFDQGAMRWAPYLVGGASYRADVRSRGALYLLVALGVEGPAARGVVPAVELGVGGGLRVGIALRRSARTR